MLVLGRASDDTDLQLTYLDRDEERCPRLFVVSAGHIRDLNASDDHLERSDLEPVGDPAQSWNALTVGAYSETDNMAGAPDAFAGYLPIAPRGDRSRCSPLIAEARIHPYERDGNAGDGRVREMNLHELPWPKDELEVLGDSQVRLRVTLWYFIEPNPSSRGWTGRYVYPSRGLGFAMRRPEDSVESFRRRINTRARIDGNRPPTLQTEASWLFGASQQQAAGSPHTDIGPAPLVDLASKGSIAIYPVSGWWKNRRAYGQSDQGVDYSLVVSIAADVDLWTAVAQQISPAVVVET